MATRRRGFTMRWLELKHQQARRSTRVQHRLPRTVKIGQDPHKGRILKTTTPLAPGDVVFEDSPVVSASWDEDKCFECLEKHSVETCPVAAQLYPTAVLTAIPSGELKLRDMNAIEELDRARCLVKAMWLHSRDSRVRKMFSRMAASRTADCAETAKEIVADPQLRTLFPPNTTQAELALVLGGLNTNSHELPNIGSGLFPNAHLLEHSCLPSCAFNTHGTSLWVCAMTNLKPGDTLSIDYGDAAYESTVERRQHLLRSYGFTCECAACVSLPDRSRSFRCVQCPGRVCPLGDGRGKPWQCLDCGCKVDGKRRAECEAAEQRLAKKPPQSLSEVSLTVVQSLVQIDKCISKGPLHEVHHLLFTPLHDLGMQLASQDERCIDGSAVRVWQRVLKCVGSVVPEFNSQNIIFFDTLAQIYVRAGNIKGAQEAWARAHAVSAVCAGANTPATKDIAQLRDNPPKNSVELVCRYQDAAV